MRWTLTFTIAISCGLAASANAASVIHSYDGKGNTDGIVAITGITQESSWRCKNDSAVLCTCSTKLFQGKIAKVDYRRGDSIAEGFVLETTKGGQYLNMGGDWDGDIGTASSSWIPRLIKPGESVLVIAEMCGASGSNAVARDIYRARLLEPTRR